MIDVRKLEANFYPVLVEGRLARAADELADSTIYSYFLLPGAERDPVPFAVSDDLVDDGFAHQMLEAAVGRRPEALEKIPLGENRYGFTHLILAAPQFHSELKGRLDADRPSAVLVVPIFESEFSGDETVGEFQVLRRDIVVANRWNREIQPRIKLRFDNARTGSGTGEDHVLVTFSRLMAEVGNLLGVADGFVEVINYKGDVIELVFGQDEYYSVMRDRNDDSAVPADFDEVGDMIWAMLNA